MPFDPDEYVQSLKGLGNSPALQVTPTAAGHQDFLVSLLAEGIHPHGFAEGTTEAQAIELLNQGPEALVAGPGSHKYSNHGLAALAHGKVVNIYLAPWFDVNQMTAASKEIVEDGYLDGLAELGSGRGTFLGAHILPSPAEWHPGAVITNQDVKTWLRTAIGTAGLPQPDSQTLYAVFLPDGVAVSFDASHAETSCAQFCGFHDALDQLTFYAVFPATDCGNCSGGRTPFDALTEVFSHEVAEAFADPVPGLGWFIDDPKDPLNGWENADTCAWQDHRYGPNGRLVQPYYTNQHGCFVGAYAPAEQPQQQPEDQHDPSFDFSQTLPFWQWILPNVPGLFAYMEAHVSPANALVLDRWLHKLRSNGFPNASAPLATDEPN